MLEDRVAAINKFLTELLLPKLVGRLSIKVRGFHGRDVRLSGDRTTATKESGGIIIIMHAAFATNKTISQIRIIHGLMGLSTKGKTGQTSTITMGLLESLGKGRGKELLFFRVELSIKLSRVLETNSNHGSRSIITTKGKGVVNGETTATTVKGKGRSTKEGRSDQKNVGKLHGRRARTKRW